MIIIKRQLMVLIVDSDTVMLDFLSEILGINDYDVLTATKGKEALSLITSSCPDLVLLELNLPDIDGLDVLKTIRRISDVPVVIVSKRSHERDKVDALDFGADDYVTKPFGTSELLARMRVALRHSRLVRGADEHLAEKIKIGDIEIDNQKRAVMLEGKFVRLTPIEYKILLLLSKNAGKVLTHEYIINEIWGPHVSDNQILRVNMSKIRKKIEKNPGAPRYILTDAGVGYRMAEE